MRQRVQPVNAKCLERLDPPFVQRQSAAKAERDEALYRFNHLLEIVAGGNGYDSCKGDSGGPAYVSIGTSYKLAGVTSRSTENSGQACGDGGVYTRVDAYADWIVGTAKANGGILP